MPPAPAKSRNWVFTLNNPDQLLDPTEWTNLNLLIYQEETGANGTLHFQGYVELSSPRALSYLRSLIPGAHWEIRKGTKADAVKYSAKEDTRTNWFGLEKPVIFMDGHIIPNELVDDAISELIASSSQATSTEKLDKLKAMIDTGATELCLADADFYTWSRHFRALERYRMLKACKRTEAMEVIVIQGPTGTGKSKYCLDNYPNAYWKQRSCWWDGYSNEDTVILDEFYGWLPYDTLLRLLDRYPLMVESKGGQLQFNSKRIVITSNKPPNKWYKNEYFAALARRVTKWIIMPDLGVQMTFDNWEQAEKHLAICHEYTEPNFIAPHHVK